MESLVKPQLMSNTLFNEVEELYTDDDIYGLIGILEHSYKCIPKPKKPKLKNVNSHESVLAYYKKLKKYNTCPIIKQKIQDYHIKRNTIHEFIVSIIKNKSGLNDIPSKNQKKVFSYVESKVDNYMGMYDLLFDLVTLF